MRLAADPTSKIPPQQEPLYHSKHIGSNKIYNLLSTTLYILYVILAQAMLYQHKLG